MWIVLDETGTEWDSFKTEEEALECIELDSDGREFSYFDEDSKF